MEEEIAISLKHLFVSSPQPSSDLNPLQTIIDSSFNAMSTIKSGATTTASTIKSGATTTASIASNVGSTIAHTPLNVIGFIATRIRGNSNASVNSITDEVEVKTGISTAKDVLNNSNVLEEDDDDFVTFGEEVMIGNPNRGKTPPPIDFSTLQTTVVENPKSRANMFEFINTRIRGNSNASTNSNIQDIEISKNTAKNILNDLDDDNEIILPLICAKNDKIDHKNEQLMITNLDTGEQISVFDFQFNNKVETSNQFPKK